MSPPTKTTPKGKPAKAKRPADEPVAQQHGAELPEVIDRDTIARTEAEIIGTSPIERTDAAPGIFPGAGARDITSDRDPADVELVEELDRLGESVDDRHELLTINMGPHHPATHGVLRVLVSLEGEVVRDLKPILGYLHTGIEKSCEKHSYWKVIPFVERMDYLAYFFSMEAFCGAVEKLLGIEIPPRAKYLRVLHMELNRIHSHLVWLGTMALDLGAMSMFWYCFRERDKILDLFEMSTGQRMHTRYFQVGGVFEDIPVGFERKVRAFCEEMPTRIDQYMALLDRNEIFLRRTKNVGIVSRERLLELGVTGPLLRAAGEPWDLRKVEDHLCYPELDFQIPVGTVGDGYDRYRVRITEMRESVKLVLQTLDGLPEGPHIVDDRKIVLPPRDELGTSMEALIHHFKLVTEGFRVPPGEVYYPVEHPRGELGCLVVADGSAKPVRVHFRDPSFVNIQALRDMSVGSYVADLIQNLAMLDPILGGIDR